MSMTGKNVTLSADASVWKQELVGMDEKWPGSAFQIFGDVTGRYNGR